MNDRLTALSISSTHMKMMIALRRVSTPTTPIVNSTAEKNSDSASISGLPPARQGDGSYNGGEQQHARDFKREEIFPEQRAGDRLDRAGGRDLVCEIARRQPQRLGPSRPRH